MPPSFDSTPLTIVVAASEAVPYAKTGGLADVAGALPHELAKLGHRITLILPGYPGLISQLDSRRSIATFRIPVGGIEAEVAVEEVAAAQSNAARVLAVRYDPYFDRPGLYQSAEGDYPDNLERFTLFSKAVLQTTEFLAAEVGAPPHVLHVHDWQTALCTVYLKCNLYPALAHLKTLLTIHNIGYQGIFPGEKFGKTDLPPTLFTPAGLEFYGSVNLLKGGIIYADAVSTVSPTYAKEIMTAELGGGLDGVLRSRGDGVRGITNGIDAATWNPATDRYLPARYSPDDLSGKRTCKRALQRQLQLPERDVPVLAVIGRLTPQKGFDLVTDIVPELMALDLQLVILGMGDRGLEQQFRDAKVRYSDRIGLSIGFDESLAHRIEAGADIFLMPSRYEPCGLTQLYSLRYGTVPIVRRTGGLADTVVPFKPSTFQSGQATGFHFLGSSPETLLSTILLALELYKDPRAWRELMLAGMRTDVSWAQAAKRYVELYRGL
jgi:starch synthase